MLHESQQIGEIPFWNMIWLIARTRPKGKFSIQQMPYPLFSPLAKSPGKYNLSDIARHSAMFAVA
jgi:hypothetical protein